VKIAGEITLDLQRPFTEKQSLLIAGLNLTLHHLYQKQRA